MTTICIPIPDLQKHKTVELEVTNRWSSSDALGTVSIHSVRAARSNPIEALRFE